MKKGINFDDGTNQGGGANQPAATQPDLLVEIKTSEWQALQTTIADLQAKVNAAGSAADVEKRLAYLEDFRNRWA